MTEQYGQNNINRPVSGSRSVDQDNIDAGLTVPAVVLNNDDDFVVLGDNGGLLYTVNLPNVAENPGREITIKAGIGIAVGVTLATLADALPAQTIEGAASVAIVAGDSFILRADPPDLSTDPATPATNWSLIKVGAP